MEPYTKKEKHNDEKLRESKKFNKAEHTCRYCGDQGFYTYYPNMCKIDVGHRDCNGKCSKYESRRKTIK